MFRRRPFFPKSPPAMTTSPALRKVPLAYGRGHLDVEFPEERTTVIEPTPQPGLADERASVLAALESPIGAAALREWITPEKRITVVHTDSTRRTSASFPGF